MKKISAAFGLALLSLTLFSACTKSDYNSGSGQTGYNPFYTQPPVTYGTFTAKVNTYDFFADIAVAATATSTGDQLTISGSKNAAAPEGMVLVVPDPATPGTYNVGGGTMIMYMAAGGTVAGVAKSGTVVIESRDEKRVKGTFNFKLNGVDVTEGKFDIAITKAKQ